MYQAAITSAAIKATDVTVTYGEGSAACHALRGVSLTVERGEMLALMGPSGSGKTTLLSVIGALLSPSLGSVRVLGTDLAGLDRPQLAAFRLANAGFVFQGYNLFPALTARENVATALALKGRPASEAAGLLEQVGLGGKLDAFPAKLSGGQKQRVAIARALAGDPPLLLADEPTAALDSSNGRMVMDLMLRLAREGKRTVVVVSHDPRVLDVADRVATIADGVIVP
ncbi:MAG TPA: ABC transporter ATP-binding protein [Magnetospirillum sp.]|jgi:putative ABC transport system ATP-binding protein|nr:ABC transporter ATP-binding protein [Magnetospirillum sp.]